MVKFKSIRPFIGANDFDRSRSFYRDVGFEEVVLSPSLCLFQRDAIAFYLQNAFVKDWIDNTMIFVEVENLSQSWAEMQALQLTVKYPETRLIPPRNFEWGTEFYLHDPSGVLWHFGEFAAKDSRHA